MEEREQFCCFVGIADRLVILKKEGFTLRFCSML